MICEKCGLSTNVICISREHEKLCRECAMDEAIKEQIKKDEACRLKLYLDSLGNLTGGWGHYFSEGDEITQEIADLLFDMDFKEVLRWYKMFGFELDDVRRSVVINMLYNLGYNKFMGFHKMISALRKHDYRTAADEMMNSLWAKQVKTRALRLHNMMLSGLM